MLFEFEKKIIVIEKRNNGIEIVHYLRGTKKNIKKDIEYFKRIARKCEIGRKQMTVWVM